MVLHHTDSLTLSNLCVSIAFFFLITCLSADQSTFVGYPSEDCRQYSVNNIVIIDDEFMHMYVKLLAQYSSELSGRHYVSMVLRYCLHVDAFCTMGHMVDHGCDTLKGPRMPPRGGE